MSLYLGLLASLGLGIVSVVNEDENNSVHSSKLSMQSMIIYDANSPKFNDNYEVRQCMVKVPSCLLTFHSVIHFH